jgi:hypothetical protein
MFDKSFIHISRGTKRPFCQWLYMHLCIFISGICSFSFFQLPVPCYKLGALFLTGYIVLVTCQHIHSLLFFLFLDELIARKALETTDLGGETKHALVFLCSSQTRILQCNYKWFAYLRVSTVGLLNRTPTPWHTCRRCCYPASLPVRRNEASRLDPPLSGRPHFRCSPVRVPLAIDCSVVWCRIALIFIAADIFASFICCINVPH